MNRGGGGVLPVFLRGAGREAGADLASLASLARALEERLATAAATWPGITVDPEEFAAYLGARVVVPDPGAPAALEFALAALCTEDLYLACACALDAPRALRAFDRCYLDRIDGFVRRFDASAAFADEVRQTLRRKLFVADPPRWPKIVLYSGHGALASWIGVAAQREALSLLRASGAGRTSDETFEDKIAEDADPELEYVRTRYRSDFRDALHQALAQLPDEDRALLNLYYVGGMSLQKLSEMKHASLATMSRRLGRARQAITAHMHTTLELRLRLTPTEVASLARLVRSSLEASLFRMLHEIGSA